MAGAVLFGGPWDGRTVDIDPGPVSIYSVAPGDRFELLGWYETTDAVDDTGRRIYVGHDAKPMERP